MLQVDPCVSWGANLRVVELERFSPRPLAAEERLAFWRRWLVEQPRGWDESGPPGSIAYRDEELAPFRAGGPVFLYVGRYTAVKRLPLLISAHRRAVELAEDDRKTLSR